MLKFIAGFAAATYIFKNSNKITKRLEEAIAKLEIKQDILLHDNPELRGPEDVL